MEKKSLYIYKLDAQGNKVKFPNDTMPAKLGEYTYTAQRMAGTPTLTATLNYPTCLDEEWTGEEFVEFRGEKYYIGQAPKVLFADSVSASHTSILIGDLAKILKQNGVEIGAKRLFVWMRRNGYLIKQPGMSYNMPSQRGMNLNLFEIKETVVTHSDGHTSINKTVKVTGTGQIYFVNKFLKQKELV